MHPYARNCPHQIKLVAVIAIASVSITALMGSAVSWYQSSLGISIGSASTLAVFGGLWWLFDTKLWRWKWARQFLLVPDLNGTWQCAGKTIIKAGEAKNLDWEATIQVVQSWSRLIVVLKTSQSQSISIAASLIKIPGMGYRLIYHYDNTPKAEEAELARHSGLTDLVFDEDVETAEGQYFTDRDRLTFGSMKLTRKKVNT